MFTKKNYLLFITLAILVLGTWIYSVPYQKWQDGKKINSSSNFLAHVDMELIDKIEVIADNENIYVIKKNNDIWTYSENNWPTEKILIDALEEKMVNVVNSEFTVVSVNSNNKINFGINDVSPRVKLFQGDMEIASFIIGSVSSDYQSTYIARENDDKTYTIPDTLVRVFDYNSWADRTITNVNAESVSTLVFNYPTQTIEMTNEPATTGEVYWRSTKPYTVRLKKEKVDEFLGEIVNLEAIDIPDQMAEDTGFDKSALTIKIKGSGIDEEFIIGDKNLDGDYYIKQTKTGRIFLITKENRDVFFKQISHFQ